MVSNACIESLSQDTFSAYGYFDNGAKWEIYTMGNPGHEAIYCYITHPVFGETRTQISHQEALRLTRSWHEQGFGGDCN